MNEPAQHPSHLAAAEKRASDLQLRLADAITRFAGNMRFVWIHATIFALWMATALGGADKYPYGLLTLIVSLEAIFLSTFVMIGQNKQAEVAAAQAAHDYENSTLELKKNTDMTEAINKLTAEIHAAVVKK